MGQDLYAALRPARPPSLPPSLSSGTYLNEPHTVVATAATTKEDTRIRPPSFPPLPSYIIKWPRHGGSYTGSNTIEEEGGSIASAALSSSRAFRGGDGGCLPTSWGGRGGGREGERGDIRFQNKN